MLISDETKPAEYLQTRLGEVFPGKNFNVQAVENGWLEINYDAYIENHAPEFARLVHEIDTIMANKFPKNNYKLIQMPF